jgi:hypothetical protein
VELGAGLAGTQLGKPLLGSFSQPVEIGVRGQRLRHDTPSFLMPGDRTSGEKEGDVSSLLLGWVEPLTRSVRRPIG